MTLAADLPTVFLPHLPKQALNTLSPLDAETIASHLVHLRTLLIPDVYGTSSVKESTSISSASNGNNKLKYIENQVKSRLSSSVGSVTSVLSEASASVTGAPLDGFEREWAEKWLHGLISRGEGWLAEVEPEQYEDDDDDDDGQDVHEFDPEDNLSKADSVTRREHQLQWEEHGRREKVLKEASGLISSLAGCAAGGGITRVLPFPLTVPPEADGMEPPEIKLSVYDAPLSDHTSVGVQTWGSAILLGRIFAQHPKRYLLNADTPLGHDTSANHSSPRILELGAGTGVMSILCRLLLDHLSKDQQPRATGVYGHVLATDYHPLVLDNLQRCIDLNFKEGYDPEQAGLSCEQAQQDPVSQKPERQGRDTGVQGLEALLLDWREFPAIVQQWQQEETRGKDVTARRLEPSAPLSDGIWTLPAASTFDPAGENLVTPCMRSLLQDPWDMIIAADCVYDLAHAGMIRDVVKWCLRVPEMDTSGKVIREGGVLHLLSPIRPTYAEETASIMRAFPSSSSIPPRSERAAAAAKLRNELNLESEQGRSTLSAKLAAAAAVNDSRSGQGTPPSTRSRPPPPVVASTRHTPSVAPSGVATPSLAQQFSTPLDDTELRRLLACHMGRGDADGWVLATRHRRELARMKGSGRSDEVEYWWWEIGWC